MLQLMESHGFYFVGLERGKIPPSIAEAAVSVFHG